MEASSARDLVPPQDLSAEQATLGSMLIEPDAVARALAVVRPEDFYRDAHQAIAKAIEAIRARKQPVDMVTVTGELRDTGKLSDCGGTAYLTSLIDSVPTASHIVRYARIVADQAAKRRYIQMGSRLAGMGYNGSEASAIYDWLQQQMRSENERSKVKETVRVKEVASGTMERYESNAAAYRAAQFQPRGVLFGHAELDRATMGLRPPMLGLVMGKSGTGKTTLCCQSVVASVLRAKTPLRTMWLPWEMTAQGVTDKLVVISSGVNKKNASLGLLGEAELGLMAKTANDLYKAPLWITYAQGWGINDVERAVRERVREGGLDYLVIDYLQLMTGYETRKEWQRFSDMARVLLDLSKELNLVILCVSQESGYGVEETTTRGGRGPYDAADWTIQILRDGDGEEGKVQGYTGRLLVRKDRNGFSAGSRLRYVFDKARDFYWGESELSQARAEGLKDLPDIPDREETPKRGKRGDHDNWN